MLNYEETIDYIIKAKNGDENAKSIIFENNSALLKSIIKKFKNKGVEYEDLYQIASIGLVKAIKNFDESFGVVFSTYAVPMIIGEIKRFLRDDGTVKVSRCIKERATAIKMTSEGERVRNPHLTLDYATYMQLLGLEQAVWNDIAYAVVTLKTENVSASEFSVTIFTQVDGTEYKSKGKNTFHKRYLL